MKGLNRLENQKKFLKEILKKSLAFPMVLYQNSLSQTRIMCKIKKPAPAPPGTGRIPPKMDARNNTPILYHLRGKYHSFFLLTTLFLEDDIAAFGGGILRRFSILCTTAPCFRCRLFHASRRPDSLLPLPGSTSHRLRSFGRPTAPSR